MKTIHTRERLDETVPGSPNNPNGEGIARHAKLRGEGLYSVGQAQARLGMTPARINALLRRWGVEERGERLVVTAEIYRRLEREKP